MKLKDSFTTRELSYIGSFLANNDLLPVDDIKIGFNLVLNKYELKIRKGDREARLILKTIRVLSAKTRTQLLKEFGKDDYANR